MKIRIITPVLLALLIGAAAPLRAEDFAAAGPAVPNTPRQVTPESIAAPPPDSPDASKIDASDVKSLDAKPADALDGKTLDSAPATAAGDNADGIVATVNDEPISDFELRQRMALYAATSLNTKLSDLKPEDYKRLRDQILQTLEDEKVRLQEAQKGHITVSPTEVDKEIAQMLAGNKGPDGRPLTMEELRTILANGGTSEEALRAELTAQIAWRKTVQDRYGSEINISQTDIDAEMSRAAEGATKPHFLVSEIFLAVDNPDQDAKIQKDAQNLETQLQQGASFPSLARQFSQNSTAAQGGNLDWVHEGQLAPELSAALSAMKVGEISQPIRSVGGYYILALRARQEPLGTKIEQAPVGAVSPSGTLKLARLLLPVGANPSQDVIENAMKIAGQIRAGYGGCAQLAELPKQIHGAVFYDMGETKLSDLSPDLQKGLAATKPGEMAPPMISDAGIELIGRCDARVEERTAFTLPTRQEIQDQLFNSQISTLSRRYMRDLKRDADVEVR